MKSGIYPCAFACEIVADTCLDLQAGVYAVGHRGRHFAYTCSTWAGDSGGALIVLDGRVVGIHLETINQAKQLRERLHAMEGLQLGGSQDEQSIPELAERINDIEGSLSSVIECLASGEIAIACSAFLDILKEKMG